MFPGERVPDKIGAYSVTKYVGQSGSADVYIARMDGPLGFSRTVTLKMVRYAMEDDARFAEELAREAAICARLNHPAVVRMFDFFEYERRVVLVLEHIDGATFEKLSAHLGRRKQRLGDNAILYAGAQIASALAHGHAATDDQGNSTPVIHRNVQPENVLVSWDGQVRLSGFGLGKILGRTPDSVVGTVSGTPGYMSPEQSRGERATTRSDVFGLGMFLYSLFTDTTPVADGRKPDSLVELRPDIPREIAAAIDAALEPSPDRRRISCLDLAQWLSKVMNPERGKEELRQKVLALRATRGPTGEVTDNLGRSLVARPAARPRRRQTLGTMRAPLRRSALVGSSYPAPPPASSRPSSGGSSNVGSTRAERMKSQSAASARPGTESSRPPPSSGRTMRLPPPPPLPGEAPSSMRSSQTGSMRVTAQSTRAPATLRPGQTGPGDTRSTPPRPLSRPAPAGSGTPAAGSSPPRQTVRPIAVVDPPRSVPPPYGFHIPFVPPGAQAPGSAPPWPVPQYGDPSNGSARPGAVSPSQPASAPIFTEHPASLEPMGIGASGLHPQPPLDTNLPAQGYRARSLDRPLSAMQQILLTAATAAIVVVVGLVVLQRTSSSPANAHEKTAATTPAPSDPLPNKTTSRGDDRSSSPDATPAAATHPEADDASKLSEQLAYLTVKGPPNSDVYINGMLKGPTNERIVVPCGRWFLRLAPPNPGRFPAWMGKGETVLIPCRESTILTVTIDDTGKDKDAPNKPERGTFGL